MRTRGGCIRCGGPVAEGLAVCGDCNPAGLPSPSPSQYHATVFIAILLTIAIATALAMMRG